MSRRHNNNINDQAAVSYYTSKYGNDTEDFKARIHPGSEDPVPQQWRLGQAVGMDKNASYNKTTMGRRHRSATKQPSNRI